MLAVTETPSLRTSIGIHHLAAVRRPLWSVSGTYVQALRGNIAANSSDDVAGPETSSEKIDIWMHGQSGNAAPAHSISGANTGLVTPTFLQYDSADNLYVLDVGASPCCTVDVFQAGQYGNSAPLYSFAVDSGAGVMGICGVLVSNLQCQTGTMLRKRIR